MKAGFFLRPENLPARAAIGFTIPVLLVLIFTAMHPDGYYFLAAGPVCGIVGGLACGRKWGLALVLGFCFGIVGLMFSLQETRSALFTDVIWTGFVSAFLFWLAGGCAVLALPAEMRFNGAAAFAVPGAIAGMVFQFLYGPGHFLFDLESRRWWRTTPWEHLILWLLAGSVGGWLFGLAWQRHASPRRDAKCIENNPWAIASIVCGLFGLAIGAVYFVRAALPLGLYNTLSPAAAAADWLWGWGLLAAGIAMIALFRRNRGLWTGTGIALAAALVLTSYAVEAHSWKSRFNSKYASKLLRENSGSGDAIYAGNLILAQIALDNNDVATAKRYLLQAAATPGARRIELNGLDVSVARVLFDRGEKDAVLEYLHQGRSLWPQGAQLITRWETAIRAGRRPNFNTRGPGGQGIPQDR